MTGSGQPIERRTDSSRVTIRMVPITTSVVFGLPTRIASSA